MTLARHHHHGHGGHGHHHGGGRGWWRGGGGGGGYWPNGYYTEPTFVISCPPTYDPVVGTDGRMYDNSCYANAAGVAVAKQLPRGTNPMSGAGLGELTTKEKWAYGGAAALGAVGLAFALWPKPHKQLRGARRRRRR